MERETWYAAVYGVTKSQTGLSDWKTTKQIMKTEGPLLQNTDDAHFLLTGAYPVMLAIRNEMSQNREGDQSTQWGQFFHRLWFD